MPWKETCPMDERVKFISDWMEEEVSVSDLCLIYGISRKSGYKWIGRYKELGRKGLEEMSRAPHVHPNQTPASTEKRLLEFRHQHPHWGPKKLIHRLNKIRPEVLWPTNSTAGEILRRHGLTKPRGRPLRTPEYSGTIQKAQDPNDIWGADFKGWFRTGNGRRVDPLTITDLASRYLIACQSMRMMTVSFVRPCFEEAFREHGLPSIIRTDNGWPFAGIGVGGLSQLSVWWIRLGIMPERIRLGHPEENGSHERMHRSLKMHTASPPERSPCMQQKSFNRFRKEFNEERPHESLGMDTPSEHYRPSARPFPNKLPELDYGPGIEVRRVRQNGEIKWNGTHCFLSESLVGESVGLQQVDEHLWTVSFGPVPLATFDESKSKLLRIESVKLSPMFPVQSVTHVPA